MADFAAIQARLGAAWAANRPGSVTPHVIVALPSFGIGESVLRHYADRLAPLEHRFLHAAFMLRTIPVCEFALVCSQQPEPEVLDYYARLVAPEDPGALLAHLHIIEVPDRSARSVTLKLLERPDLVAELSELTEGRLAMIEPWNVTAPEVELAMALGVPVNGTAPDLWPLGFKSAGRRLFENAGVPVPLGREDVRDVGQVDAAIEEIRSANPFAAGVVVKLDDSGAGEGNHVVSLRGPTGSPRSVEEIRHALTEMPAWYVDSLADGGIVEELVAGEGFASPSAQLDIAPDGGVHLLATHEQVLGGDTGQVYMGCRFPANPAYAGQLARHGRAVGHELARSGAVGRFAVDFVAVRGGGWNLYALEVNLRKGGTTHPYTALRHLVPGRYDQTAGWVSEDGTTRCYRSTDNLVDPAWRGLAPAAVIDAVEAAGLGFDHATRTGVVLHMLSCLAVDGRLGFTAIGVAPQQVEEMDGAVRAAINGCV